MHGRPHHVIDIVCVVLKRVQRLVVLKKRERERERASGIIVDDTVEIERKERKRRAREKEWREGVSERQTERRCLSLGACLGAEPN